MCAADSAELSNFGVTAGHTNYAACYATGLLLARRLLKNKGIKTAGNDKPDGNLWSVQKQFEKDGGNRPFRANLDVGLVRTTTGNRVFGAMKGAADGGIDVPHEARRFPGFKVIKAEVQTNKRGKKVEDADAGKKTEFDAKVMKAHIFGEHVQTYYDLLKKGDKAAFTKQFGKWEKCLAAAKAKNMQELWTKCHAAIRANPDRKSKKNAKPTRKVVTKAPGLVQQDSKGRKWLREQKVSLKAKKEKIAKVVKAVQARYGRK